MSAQRIPAWAGDGDEPHEFPARTAEQHRRDRLRSWAAHQPFVHRALDVALIGMLPGIGAYARFIAPHTVEITDTVIPVRSLPAAFDGFRVVHLSDMHLGANVPVDYLRRCVQLANGCDPDAIVLTGDFLQWDGSYVDVIAEVVDGLSAPEGVFAVWGNHDYGLNSPAGEPLLPGAPEAMERAFTRAGVTVLRNDRRRLVRRSAHLDVVGVDDLWSGACDPDVAFGADDGATRLFLCHNPDGYGFARRHRFEVMLAGHTHGAQVRFPRLSPPVLPLRDRRLLAGFYGRSGCWLFVSRGLGYIWKVRLNSAPEIACHRLTVASDEPVPSVTSAQTPTRVRRFRQRWRG